MTRWANEPDGAAHVLISGALDELALAGAVLWAAAEQPPVALMSEQADFCIWRRRVRQHQPGTAEPPPGPFSTALLRLPKSRSEQIMSAHLCLGALIPSGRLIVYGGNDEGIRSFQKTLNELGTTTTLATRGHGRIIELQRRDITGPLKPRIGDWRQLHGPTVGEDRQPWISYPGLFAGGDLDPGTALLLQHLPQLPRGAAVLDYGAGPGAIAAELRRHHPHVELTLLDNDSVALLAASENVPGATLIADDRLSAAAGQRFDLIVSNPPLHLGFKEDHTPLHRLIADAPHHLKPGGMLLLVVQARIALDRALTASFSSAEACANDGRYRVWRGSGAKAARSASG